ncbi:MAG: TVP38/TMEM64 family protein [Geminicoccaceae bacterium]
MRASWRLLPLVLVLTALGAAWALGLPRLLSWRALAQHQAWLTHVVETHPVAAAGAYLLLYSLLTALSIPQGAVLTVLGGFLFGTIVGTALTVLGATAGAVLLFLAVRHALAPALAPRAGPWLARVRPSLERDGFSYLFAVRLVPVVPFWLLNLASALAGMRLATFTLATLIGIIPGTAIFSSIGAGLGTLVAAGERPDLSAILSARLLLPLLGLSVLSLLPVLWRHWKGSHA